LLYVKGWRHKKEVQGAIIVGKRRGMPRPGKFYGEELGSAKLVARSRSAFPTRKVKKGALVILATRGG